MNHEHRHSTAPASGPGTERTQALVSYMVESAESSLYRNGKVFTRRDRDGNDAGSEGIDTEEVTIAIGDARSLKREYRRTIEIHGFELLDRPLERPNLDFYDHQQVVRDYYPECAAILREATGAAHVFAG